MSLSEYSESNPGNLNSGSVSSNAANFSNLPYPNIYANLENNNNNYNGNNNDDNSNSSSN